MHLIKGYGDTAVAECAIALMWEGARGLAKMDRGIRAGNWLRDDGMQLTGKTLGLIGFGGIAAEVARIALGSGMRVIAWNRSPKKHPKVEFVDLDELLTESDVVSIHLLLNDETRGLISAACIEAMKPGVILVNTARGAIVDEKAMIDALKSGQIRHAGLDVFNIEPLPADHPLTKLENVTLSAHSAFRTPEASENLIARRGSIAGGLRRSKCAPRRASAVPTINDCSGWRHASLCPPYDGQTRDAPHPEEARKRRLEGWAARAIGAFMVRDGARASSP